MFETTIEGVDVYVDITYYHKEPGATNPYSVDSDQDYYGYEEVEFELYDGDGASLEQMFSSLSISEYKRIEQECFEHIKEIG